MAIHNTRILPVALAAVIAGVGFAGSANADTIVRTEFIMPTHNCQAALPVFDTAIRKRPLGYQNEGTSPTFVTCGLMGANAAAPLITLAGLFLRNNTDADIAVDCTFVDAGDGFNTPLYVPRSVTLPASSSSSLIAWDVSDNGGSAFVYPSISCALPPGTGITATAYQFPEEIGTL